MIKFKACPRCHGDLIVGRDEYGWVENCMQCGFSRDLKVVTEPEDISLAARRIHRAAAQNNANSSGDKTS